MKMELYIMKEDALGRLKACLSDLYINYYTQDDNQWIFDFFEQNGISQPFSKYKDINDFTLADLKQKNKGEIDYENCKIIYENLSFLSPSQASDERLWAGLAHTVFYHYMKERWNYCADTLTEEKRDIGNIRTRYFFKSGTRSGFFRNTLAKCWWVGKSTYDKSNIRNPFEKLDILGKNDLTSKISYIFYSNTFASNQKILDGIILAFQYFKERDIKIGAKTHIRPAMQSLNAYGGCIVLDCLTKEEICEKVKSDILNIINGKTMDVEVDDFSEEGIDEEAEELIDTVQVVTEQEVAMTKEDEERVIKVGDKVAIIRINDEKNKVLSVALEFPESMKLVGKTVGNTVRIKGYDYHIRSIV